MKYEVVERATGARMSHQKGQGELMGTTLFGSQDEAFAWMDANGLTLATHNVVPAKS